MLLSNSNQTEVEETENGEQEDEEEALSLCDLPIKKESRQPKRDSQQENKTFQDNNEFDFCSFSTESEMCSADQVFFQGQILPFRHSISSETGLISSTSRSSSTTSRRCLSRSESMSSYNSSGFTSRSSSQKSSTTTTSSSTYGGRSSVTTPMYKPRIHNNFSSHPSPKPQVKISRIKNQGMPNSNQKSTVWSLFRLGIVTTPEIVLEDLKHRSINNNKSFQKSKSFGSHSINDYDNYTRSKSEKKKKQGIFEVNGTLFGSCKCSSNAVDTIPSRIGTIERSISAKYTFTHEERKGTKQQQERKQSISRNRTFEWLKQISLDGSISVRNDA
ncbi:hypothetical protein Leryth_013686 [Lithospermum erythrorhizon]|nr:hypothetical protein Leryth_013686 [Lithospermum erythrorhizon]